MSSDPENSCLDELQQRVERLASLASSNPDCADKFAPELNAMRACIATLRGTGGIGGGEGSDGAAKATKAYATRLARERDLLQAVMDASHTGLVYLDREFNFVLVNEAYARGGGRSKDEFPGHNHFEYYANEENERLFRTAVETGELISHAAKPFSFADHPDWGVTYWDWRLTPIKDGTGAVDGLVLSLSDVTQQTRAEQALNEINSKYRDLVDNLQEGLLTSDATGRTTFVNRRLADLLGYSVDEMIGEPVSRWVMEGDGNEPTSRLGDRSNGPGGSYDTDLRRRDGSHLPAYVLEVALLDKGERYRGSQVAVVDMTQRRKVEHALGESERRLRTLLEGSPMLAFEQDSDLRYTWLCNPYGPYAQGGLLGRTDAEAEGVGQPPELLELKRAVLASGESSRREAAYIVGGRRWVLDLKIDPLKDVAGKTAGLRCAAWDITGLRESLESLEHTERRFALALKDSPITVFEQDRDLRYTWLYNPLGGWEASGLIGRSERDLDTTVSAPNTVEVKQRVMESRVPERHDVRLLSPGGDRAYDLHVEPLLDLGRVVGVACATIDITDRIRAAEQADALNAELEARAAKLALANQELDSFAYSVSHDLRSPLRAVDGYSRILITEHGAGLSPESARLVNLIRHNAQRMDRLIRDLLEFSRLAQVQVRKTVVDVSALARRAFSEVCPEPLEHGVELGIGELPLAYGDPALLYRVLVNLLGNAVKFSRSRKPPLIDITGSEVGGECVYTVRDNGVGFDMAYAPLLFGVFQRLHRTDEFEGTGAGLALVRRIVARHGGRVWAEGQVGIGATFFFSLPRKEL